MDKIDNYTFSDGHNVITFDTKNAKLAADKVTLLYPFLVVDNLLLTNKLKLAVKRTFLPVASFEPCAAALFEMIRTESYEPLTTQEEYQLLVDRFIEKYRSAPNFIMKSIGTRLSPQYSAEINHEELYHPYQFKARTSKEAQAKVLKSILDVIPSS